MPIHATQRLFFAALPDAPARAQLAALAERLKQDYPARWIRPSRYHLTLCFLGAREGFEASFIEQARQAASRVHMAAFVWRPDRVAGFRAARPPCVLRADAVDASLQHLHQTLLEALVQQGVSVSDRHRYLPHVTLGYGRDRAMTARTVPTVAFPVRAFVLLHSVPGEADYRELGRWPLDGT
ncbi:MAG TPA: RNA 2',3'-cyclic phosphodiesterase [Oleiagrimonas sp.]|nr:RNA 2',3'-cyclic phosphodiesterase [Oleiagrimonas sp.]